MKQGKRLISLLILFTTQTINSAQATKPDNQVAIKDSVIKSPGALFSQASLIAIGTYTDFKFDASQGINYQLFRGHSKLGSIGGDNIILAPTWMAGLSLFRAETQIQSQLTINPQNSFRTAQNIQNNTLFGHLMKQINQNVLFDVAGAYGRNKTNTISWTDLESDTGYAKANGSNWFASATGIYSKITNRLLTTISGRLLFTQVNNDAYSFRFNSSRPDQSIAPFTNNSLFLMENIELAYNPEKLPNWNPFVNGGLVQILSYKNSTTFTAPAINGISPQFNLDENAFHVGGGLSYSYRQFTIRLEEQYYKAGDIYSSMQTILFLRYLT